MRTHILEAVDMDDALAQLRFQRVVAVSPHEIGTTISGFRVVSYLVITEPEGD